MKKVILLFCIACTCITVSAQKKENGSLYIEHPAIKVVNDFINASVAGDSAQIASFLTDGFKAYNGTTSTFYSDSGMNKKQFINTLLMYNRHLDYYSRNAIPGSYPDALVYKKDNKNDMTTVQNWNIIKGVEKETGVKIDAAAFGIYNVTKDGKIASIINYSNGRVIDQIDASFTNRTNGKIYDHHPNINTIRKIMYAFEHGDIDKSLSAYSEDAKFSDINTEWGKNWGLADEKAGRENFLKNYEIKSIDIIGYPDYLEYEQGNARSVLSWWRINLIRKSDKKAIALPLHLNDDFDENGKIVSEISYFSETLLMKK
ncbi:MAG: nuclear transport factor 2 family protein [Bacteroidetes bacterium]|nr:nuclear transport factor 2 family protein [Bacteroidota bacterium]MBS1757085.1 nuclear transport factor 2 family protein [Bacteroidota bacterium]